MQMELNQPEVPEGRIMGLHAELARLKVGAPHSPIAVPTPIGGGTPTSTSPAGASPKGVGAPFVTVGPRPSYATVHQQPPPQYESTISIRMPPPPAYHQRERGLADRAVRADRAESSNSLPGVPAVDTSLESCRVSVDQQDSSGLERGSPAGNNRAQREQATFQKALQLQMAEVRRLNGDLNVERERYCQLEQQLEEQSRLNYELAQSTHRLQAQVTELTILQQQSNERASRDDSTPPPPQLQLQLGTQPQRKMTRKQAERDKEETNKEARIAVLERMLEMKDREIARSNGTLVVTVASSAVQTDPPFRCAMSMQTEGDHHHHDASFLSAASSAHATPYTARTPDPTADAGAYVDVSIQNALQKLTTSRLITLRVYTTPEKEKEKKEGMTHSRSSSRRSNTPPAPQLLSGRWADETVDLEFATGGEVVVPASQGGATKPGHQATDSSGSAGNSGSPVKVGHHSVPVATQGSFRSTGPPAMGAVDRGMALGNFAQTLGRPAQGNGNGRQGSGRHYSTSLPTPTVSVGMYPSQGVPGQRKPYGSPPQTQPHPQAQRRWA